MNIIIAAGGTGGHINPGIAIAQEIKKNKPDANIIFIGTSHGIEKDLVKKAGFEIKFIHSKGLSGGALKKTGALFSNFAGVIDSYRVIKKIKPKIVIGTGGYVCAPVLFVAKKLCGIPVFIHESNAIAGKTNRFIGQFADKIAVGFESAGKNFKKPVVVTGNPVKEEIYSLRKAKSGERKNVLIFGGSQGAKTINNAVVELISAYSSKISYNIIYATGTKQYGTVMEELEKRKVRLSDHIKIESYIYKMPEVLSKADLVVSRAGALTVSELCAAGISAILIPLSTAAENHQEYNAKVMVNAGSGRIVHDNELTGERLKNEIEDMLNKDLTSEIENAKKKISKNGSKEFYKMIEEYL